MFLDDILSYKKKLIEQDKKKLPINKVISMCDYDRSARNFKNALCGDNLKIMAEIKKASPSKGVIREEFVVSKIAEEYEKNNIDAISVLTEDKYFLGKKEYINDVKSIVSVPVLRKDFIIDEYQIYESKMLNADAILLIAVVLSPSELNKFKRTADELGLHCLVETHSREDIEKAADAGAEIIGINNRDLRDFKTDIRNTEKLIKYVPQSVVRVSESGVKNHNDLVYLSKLGINAVLIGGAIMGSGNITEKLDELREG